MKPDYDPAAQHAWELVRGVYLAGRQVERWDVDNELIVVSLRRESTDYTAATARIIGVDHRPYPFWRWSVSVGATVLHAVVGHIDVRAAKGPVLVHCTRGVNRAGVVGIGLLLRSGMSLEEAYARYDLRGVQRPGGKGALVLTEYARRQGIPSQWEPRYHRGD